MSKFSFGGKTGTNQAGRFRSDLMSGKTKNGTYKRQYGITNGGKKWSSTTFNNKVKIQKGKNAGKNAWVKKTVFTTEKFYNPRK